MSNAGLTSKDFWVATAERAIRTVAQAAVAVLGVGATGILDVDWQGVISAALLAGVLSVLTAVASVNVGDSGPSLANESVLPTKDDPPVAAVKDDDTK